MALLTVPSRESLHAEGISDYAASQPTKSVARGSTVYLLIRTISGLIWSILAKLLFFDKQRLPDNADRAYLERWGNDFQFPPLGAVGASRLLALRVSGTAGSPVTHLAVLTHADGTQYQVDSIGAVVAVGGTVDVSVSAISTGLATNKIAGETLTFSSPPLGVTAAAVLVLDLQNGVDVEETEHYRSRLISHLGDAPVGGAIHDYIEWALQVPGNITAYVWKNRRGQGTLDVAVLGGGHGASRVITDLIDTQEYLDDDTRRPGNVEDVLVLTTTTTAQDVKIGISIDETAYRWDWTDDGTGYIVTAEDEGLSTITAAAPASVVAGVRITVHGEEATVTTRVGDVLTLSFTEDQDGEAVSWFAVAPTGGYVRASGDLVVPVRNAVLALFDRIGPARNTTYAQTQWESGIQTDSLITSARNVLGCTKASVVTPVADVTPADPLYTANDEASEVPLLIPGNVEIVKL